MSVNLPAAGETPWDAKLNAAITGIDADLQAFKALPPAGGGGFVGAWNTSTAYPAGSIVTYGGFSWGTTTSVAAGQLPPSVPGATTVPVGSDNAASAPAIVVGTQTSASSALWNTAAFTTEAGEPAYGGNFNVKSSWLKYSPIAGGQMMVDCTGSDYNPIYVTFWLWNGGGAAFNFASLSSIGYTTQPAAAYGLFVASGQVIYIQISGGGNVKLNIAQAPATAAVTSPWSKLGAIA